MEGVAPLPPTLAEQRHVLLEHFELSVALHGEVPASRMMRKFGIRFSAHHPEGEDVRRRFIACRSVDEWRAVIDEAYVREEPVERLPVEKQNPASGFLIGGELVVRGARRKGQEGEHERESKKWCLHFGLKTQSYRSGGDATLEPDAGAF